jgi:hypothetical protein
MLSPIGCHFNWSVDNFGSTYSDAGFGVSSPGHANANTKGANTQMLVGIAEDCYGILICFAGGTTAATINRFLVDLLIDPAAGVGGAGSAWTVVINNLYAPYASICCGGYNYYFPLYLKAGTAIGTANQALVAARAIRVGIRCYGEPTRPELLRCGTKVQTYGASTGTTTGTTIAPGSIAMGSWSASLGTSSYDQFWWQGGIGYNDTTIGGGTSISETTFLDISASNDAGTTKVICAENIRANFSTTEQGGKEAFGSRDPYRDVPSGANVYMRGAATITANTTPTCVAYGLGG